MTIVGKIVGWLTAAWNELPMRARLWVQAVAITFGLAVLDALTTEWASGGKIDWYSTIKTAMVAFLVSLKRSPLQVRASDSTDRRAGG